MTVIRRASLRALVRELSLRKNTPDENRLTQRGRHPKRWRPRLSFRALAFRRPTPVRASRYPVQAAIRPDFREQAQGLRSRQPLRIGQVQFDHLDIVPDQLQPVFFRCGVEQFMNVAPIADERLCIIDDLLQRALATLQIGELFVQVAIFPLQPREFRLDTGRSLRSEVLQHFHKPADIGPGLLLLPAENVFLLMQGRRDRMAFMFKHDGLRPKSSRKPG